MNPFAEASTAVYSEQDASFGALDLLPLAPNGGICIRAIIHPPVQKIVILFHDKVPHKIRVSLIREMTNKTRDYLRQTSAVFKPSDAASGDTSGDASMVNALVSVNDFIGENGVIAVFEIHKFESLVFYWICGVFTCMAAAENNRTMHCISSGETDIPHCVMQMLYTREYQN
jgi:hypothetical protein